MTVKTTGAELKRFYADDVSWPVTDGDEIWHDDEVVTVDGKIQENGLEVDDLADTAVVTLSGGIVYSPRWDREDAPSLEAYFKSWRKREKTATIIVECDLDQAEEMKAVIKAAGGKIRA